jgi:hypothetical protein
MPEALMYKALGLNFGSKFDLLPKTAETTSRQPKRYTTFFVVLKNNRVLSHNGPDTELLSC